METKLAKIIIGDTTIEVEMPAKTFDLLSEHGKKGVRLNAFTYTTKAITESLIKFIDKNERPPSAKQLSYLTSIEQTLGVTAPDAAAESLIACSEFISQHDEAMKQYIEWKNKRKALRQLCSQAIRLVRLEQAEALLQTHSLEEVAEKMGVRPPTIKKYTEELIQCRIDYKEQGAYDFMMRLVELSRLGNDLYGSDVELEFIGEPPVIG